MAQCDICGTSTKWGAAYCDRCAELVNTVGADEAVKRVRSNNEASAVAGTSDSAVPHKPSSSPVVNRYQDAYRVGAALVGLGDGLKLVGAIATGIIALGSLSQLGENAFGLVGVFVAAIVGALFWIGGVIVAAQGQVVRATLDSAVAHSPFLTDLERLDSMGLPRSIAERTVGAQGA